MEKDTVEAHFTKHLANCQKKQQKSHDSKGYLDKLLYFPYILGLKHPFLTISAKFHIFIPNFQYFPNILLDCPPLSYGPFVAKLGNIFGNYV